MLIGAICMVLSSSITLSVVGILILTVGMGATNAAVFKILPEAVPHAIGGASGCIGGIGSLGGFVIPPIMASFINKSSKNLTGYSAGFIIFIILSTDSLVMLKIINKASKQV